MSEKIQHTGVVERVEAGRLTVRIQQTSACAACGAKGLCHAAESKEKLIDVRHPIQGTYVAGQEVTIEGASSFGMKAVRLAFVYPLALMLVAMIVLTRLTTVSEPVLALAAVGVVLAWYVGLSFFKERLRTTFSFQIKEEKQQS